MKTVPAKDIKPGDTILLIDVPDQPMARRIVTSVYPASFTRMIVEWGSGWTNLTKDSKLVVVGPAKMAQPG